MLIQIFRPPNDGDKLMDCKLGDICDSLSLEYEDFFCGVGTFTLELPVNTVFADKISENVLLYCRDDDICFIVKNILEAVDKLTITGYTLNGLLRDRLTMPRETGVAGAEGKDCISGSTETCVKHFVDYNMISSDDEARNYPRLAVAEDMGRGLVEDSNLVGMECVDDIVRSMCESAGLGYRISLNIDSDARGPLLIFDVGERVDRTANQSERNRVIFSVGLKNITGMQRETGITAEKNALWCDTGGLNGFVFKGDEAPISWNRREDYISLAVTDEYSESEIQLFARKEMADKFAETDSLTIDAGNPLDYGTLYKLGDIVTVWDKNKSVQLNSVISAVTVKRSGTEHTVSLTLGESKPKLLDSYAKQTDILKKNQRDFPASEIVNTTTKLGTLSTYTYLTDSSIKYNAMIYTVEKNDAGLITKISNDAGGEFVPTIGGDISDVAFHNAVLTAVAMLCGLDAKPTVEMMPGRDGLVGYFVPETLGVGSWANAADGNNISLYGGTVSNGTLTLSDGEYGIFPCPTEPLTIYLIARAADVSQLISKTMQYVLTKHMTENVDEYHFDLGIYGVSQWSARYSKSGSFSPGGSVDEYCVLCIKRTSSGVSSYINGVSKSSSTADFYSGYYAGNLLLHTVNWNGGTPTKHTTPSIEYKACIFATERHSTEMIAANSQWLMDRYGIISTT